MKKERRAFARLYVGEESTYRQEGKAEVQTTVLVQDISISGVRFISNEPLSRDAVLEFTLLIPGISTAITAAGKVVWQKQISKSFYDTGIEFTKIDGKHKKKLSKYIKSILGRVEEKRRFMRCNLSIMVAYQLESRLENKKNCLSIDISSTGLRIFLKEKLENGTHLQLSFNLPDETIMITVQGIIVWHKERESNFFEAGIEFTTIKDEDADKINNFVKKNLGVEW